MQQKTAQFVNGMADIFAPYDGFILDLWGVVHDGVAPFPATIPTLQLLKKAKRKIWLLSNAPRRASVVMERLDEMGIARDLYDGIMTSGEAAHHALGDKYLAKWGRRCLHIGSERDRSLYEGLDIELVTTVQTADFILNSGVENFADTAEKYHPLLEACAARQLPMICANPDKVVHVGAQLVICAGTLAEYYESIEGQVAYFGKPHRAVYSLCLEALGTRNVLAVGDSMLTDIAGATGAGIDSVLVTSGIHREERLDTENNHGLDDFLIKYPYSPKYLMKQFSWE
jgi:HAD superfamily hydrolase (TIGR01459 family)